MFVADPCITPAALDAHTDDLIRPYQNLMTPPLRSACKQEAKEKFLAETDVLRLSMASNLSDYRIETKTGQVMRFVVIKVEFSLHHLISPPLLPTSGHHILFYDTRAGLCKTPMDCINYVTCHDNETLFDLAVLKVRGLLLPTVLASSPHPQTTRPCLSYSAPCRRLPHG